MALRRGLAGLPPLLAFVALSQTGAPPAKVDFVHDIQPIFEKSCQSCHGSKAQMAGLRLDTRASAFSKAIVAHDSANSPLFQRVAGTSTQPRMPRGGQLSAVEIDLLKRWIDQGADWPETKHWAFVPPQRPALPTVQSTEWSINPIDRFILARLDQEPGPLAHGGSNHPPSTRQPRSRRSSANSCRGGDVFGRHQQQRL